MFKKAYMLLALVFTSLNVCAVTITATDDYTSSGAVIDPLTVNLDFGVSGRKIGDVVIDIAFVDNLWDSNESIGFSFSVESVEPGLGRVVLGNAFTFVNATNSSSNAFNSTQEYEAFIANLPAGLRVPINGLANLYIDDNGLSSFDIASSGGNGFVISGITVTAELTAVPLPGAFLLFLSGFSFLMLKVTRNKH